jgi:bacterioferritin
LNWTRRQKKKPSLLYKKIIEQAQKEGDVTTAFMFKEILEDEEEHHDLFTTMLEEV